MWLKWAKKVKFKIKTNLDGKVLIFLKFCAYIAEIKLNEKSCRVNWKIIQIYKAQCWRLFVHNNVIDAQLWRDNVVRNVLRTDGGRSRWLGLLYDRQRWTIFSFYSQLFKVRCFMGRYPRIKNQMLKEKYRDGSGIVLQ